MNFKRNSDISPAKPWNKHKPPASSLSLRNFLLVCLIILAFGQVSLVLFRPSLYGAEIDFMAPFSSFLLNNSILNNVDTSPTSNDVQYGYLRKPVINSTADAIMQHNIDNTHPIAIVDEPIKQKVNFSNTSNIKTYDITPDKSSQQTLPNNVVTQILSTNDHNITTSSVPEYAKKSPSNEKLAISTLPSFTVHFEDLVIGSLIERVSDSYDLFVTTFFLSRYVVDPNEPRNSKIDKFDMNLQSEIDSYVNKITTVQYLENGKRSLGVNGGSLYTCRIHQPSLGITYDVMGEFLPNRLAADPNGNRKLDVFRCKLRDTKTIYNRLSLTAEELEVEILNNEEPIIRFSIPYKTRRSGYLLTSPSDASQFDAWNRKGYIGGGETGAETGAVDSRIHTGDRVYLCASRDFTLDTWGQRSLMHIAEFVTHHLLLGVSHIFISTDAAYQYHQMNSMLRALQYYISNQQLSIASEAYDGMNFVSSSNGFQWNFLVVKNFFVDMTLYLSKGSAEYLLVLDYNDYYIPKFPYTSIIESIKAANHEDFNFGVVDKDGKAVGFGDGKTHPLCYYGIYVVTIYPSGIKGDSVGSLYNSRELTLPKVVSKAILPIDIIFQGSVSMSGGCKLQAKWSGCATSADTGEVSDEFCYMSSRPKIISNPSHYHAFDELVTSADIKALNHSTIAFAYKCSKFGPDKSLLDTETGNEYVKRFSATVFNQMTLLKIPLDYIEGQRWGVVSDYYFEVHYKVFADHYNTVTNSSTRRLRSEYKAEDTAIKYLKLPTQSFDDSEFFLSALLGRTHFNWELHLTVFLLQREITWRPMLGYGTDKINPKSFLKWEKMIENFNTSVYRDNGIRQVKIPEEEITCRIRNTRTGKMYVASAEFMPNALTPDGNANRRVDIMRCKLSNGGDDEVRTPMGNIYSKYINTEESVHVEIYRGQTNLINFVVPWKTRKVGLGLHSTPNATIWNPWKGYPTKKSITDKKYIKSDRTVDNVYMCVPGVQSSMSQNSLLMYIEFLEFHRLLAVEHVFFTVAFTWHSQNMHELITVMKPYIERGFITISSHSDFYLDTVYSLDGMTFDRDVFKIMQVNMCLYLTKGVVDYLAIWDIDEYFIPKPPYNTILDVINAAENVGRINKPPPSDMSNNAIIELHQKQRGMADEDPHPFCYLMLHSEVLFQDQQHSKTNDPLKPWIGMKFSHAPDANKKKSNVAFKKSILPTRVIHQAALHMPGGCMFSEPWSGCHYNDPSRFCYVDRNVQMEQYGWSAKMPAGSGQYFTSMTHGFDSYVVSKDSKLVNKSTEAVIYHIQMHRPHLDVHPDSRNGSNDYTAKFFPVVHQNLIEMGYEVLVTIPMIGEIIADKNLIISNKNEADNSTQTNQESWGSYDTYRAVEFFSTPHSEYSKRSEQTTFHANTDFRHRSKLGTFPSFAYDNTELFLSSMIARKGIRDRVKQTEDKGATSTALFLTTFVLSAAEIIKNPSTNFHVDNNTLPSWHILHTSHTQRQVLREQETSKALDTYECRIYESNETDSSYTVPAIRAYMEYFDIIQCEMSVIDNSILKNYITHQQHVYVEILRVDVDTSTILTQFSIPWKYRVNNELLPECPLLHSSVTKLNPWVGFNQLPISDLSHDNEKDIHVVVHLHLEKPSYLAGYSHKPVAVGVGQEMIGLYAEFILHYLSLGVKHIHMVTSFSWDRASGNTANNNKIQLDRLIQSLKVFISQNQLSVYTSHAIGGGGRVASTTPSSSFRIKVINKQVIQFFYQNLLLHYLKSMCETILFVDINEFIIPLFALNINPLEKDVVYQNQSHALVDFVSTFTKDLEVQKICHFHELYTQDVTVYRGYESKSFHIGQRQQSDPQPSLRELLRHDGNSTHHVVKSRNMVISTSRVIYIYSDRLHRPETLATTSLAHSYVVGGGSNSQYCDRKLEAVNDISSNTNLSLQYISQRIPLVVYRFRLFQNSPVGVSAPSLSILPASTHHDSTLRNLYVTHLYPNIRNTFISRYPWLRVLVNIVPVSYSNSATDNWMKFRDVQPRMFNQTTRRNKIYGRLGLPLIPAY